MRDFFVFFGFSFAYSFVFLLIAYLCTHLGKPGGGSVSDCIMVLDFVLFFLPSFPVTFTFWIFSKWTSQIAVERYKKEHPPIPDVSRACADKLREDLKKSQFDTGFYKHLAEVRWKKILELQDALKAEKDGQIYIPDV